VTLARITDTNGNESIQMIGLDSLSFFENFIPEIQKSKLAADYLEIPLTLGWHLNRDDPERGFRILLGGKIGWLFDSKTKIRYKQGGDRKVVKVKDRYELNPWRYSVMGRLGISFIDLFGEVGLSELFKSGKGPEGAAISYWKIGIAFVGF